MEDSHLHTQLMMHIIVTCNSVVLSTLLHVTIHAYIYYVIAFILLACKDAHMSIHQTPWYLVL